MTTQDKIFDRISNTIIEKLEQGTIPWRRPWSSALPVNAKTGRPYNGINIILLLDAGFTCNQWATFKQVKDLGGHVLKGSKGTPVIYWARKTRKVEEENPETGEAETKEKPYLLIREYFVFNLEQTSLKATVVGTAGRPVEDIAEAARIVEDMPQRPTIEHGGDRAFYRPMTDTVKVPARESFTSTPEYYSTLFHELGHATGHRSRLGRDLSGSFGSEDYSQEELAAEFCAAFLCGQCGIETRTIDNSAAYIRGWLERLKNDRRMVVYAAAQGSKAAQFITDTLAPKAAKPAESLPVAAG